MREPEWMATARKFIGLREVPGMKHNKTILGWLSTLKAWWKDDETPWCGVYVAHCLHHLGNVPKYYMRAKAWADYGVPVIPQPGAILVFERPGGGHVGFYVYEDATRYYVLGGNQGNAVSVAPIDKGRCIAVRWPKNVPATGSKLTVASDGTKSSTNEA